MVNSYIKTLLGFSSKAQDCKVRKEWGKRTKNVCKPCWELRYCPYGPLVEKFPLLSPTRDEAIAHNSFLKGQLKKGAYKGAKKRLFENEVRRFNPKKYPTKYCKSDIEKSCAIFGHMCPVFFVNEPFTETSELRRVGRSIPRHIMLKVARRDNYRCQRCGRALLDNEIEFDHIIPVSKGGSSEEHNIRITCFECNRSKSNKFEK